MQLRLQRKNQANAKNKKGTTALAQLLAQSNRTAEFDDAKIIDFDKETRKIMALERIRIQQQKHCAMNYKEDIDNIL